MSPMIRPMEQFVKTLLAARRVSTPLVAIRTADPAARYPDVSVEQAEHLGCHPALLELSKCRYHEALPANSRVSAESIALVMVGRGSHDPEATAEMFRFVDLRRQLTPAACAQACFVAMAAPLLDSVLEQVTD